MERTYTSLSTKAGWHFSTRFIIEYLLTAVLLVLGVGAFAQGPNCTHINASVGLDDSARVQVQELVTNIASLNAVGDSVDIEIEGPYGQRIFYAQNLGATDTLTLYACPWLDRQLKVNVSLSGGGGSCWSYLTFKQGNGPVIIGRNLTVYCLDPIATLNPDHPDYPLEPLEAQIPCRAFIEDADFVADWITPYDCILPGTAAADTAKVIYREYEAFDKFGKRGVGYDTIIVRRLPEINEFNSFCRERDTVYCGHGSKLGPYMVLEDTSMKSGEADCEPIFFVKSYFDATTGHLKFAPADFDPKCGLSVNVDYDIFNPETCSEQYKVTVDIKQTCYGPPVLATPDCSIATFNESFHPALWSWTRTGMANGMWDGTEPIYTSTGAVNDTLDGDDATMLSLTAGMGESIKGCIVVPQDGQITFTSSAGGSYYINGWVFDFVAGPVTVDVKACDEFCIGAGAGESFTISAFVYTQAGIPPLEPFDPALFPTGNFLSAGYWRCEFWVMNLDTLPPVITCDFELTKADPSLIHEDTLYVPSSSHDCGAHTYVPPVKVVDDWAGVKYVKVRIEGITTIVLDKEGDTDIWSSHKQVKIPHSVIPVPLYYEAYDSCHNISYDTCYMKVKDLTKPVPVCDKGVIVGLSSKKVWVDATTFDEGSWDNCEINFLLARRVDWTEACVDLCDMWDPLCWNEHYDTIYSTYLEPDKHIDEVEAHYKKTMQWLKEDGRPCADILWNAWQYDLAKYTTLECIDHPYQVDEHYFNKILKEGTCDPDFFDHDGPITDAEIDLWSQIGGGWSDAVPFDCEDACQEVMVELLVMDYWCNWAKCWTWVWVEDKTPIEVKYDVKDQYEISCGSYKAKKYDFVHSDHPVSIEYIVELAKDGNAYALAKLDSLFGGYDKVWRDAYGATPPHTEGYYWDEECVCETFTKQVKEYDEHLGYIWKTIEYDSCWVRKDSIHTQSGQVVVNCGQAVQCLQDVWCSFDHCGQGYIYRKWKFIPGCYEGEKYENLGHEKDTIIRKQLIWVGNNCELDKGMFYKPHEKYVYTCGIEYDDAGNATGALSPEYTGQPEYMFDDDCRIVGINHSDKVFKIVGGDEACYKVIRTWHFIDWCYLGGKPDNASYWWLDPEYTGKTISWEQKIIVQDTVPPVCTFEEELEEVDAAGCLYTLRQTVHVSDTCGALSYYWELFDITKDKDLVASASGDLEGTETSFEIEVEDLLAGDYHLKVRVTDECQNESYCTDYFTVKTGKKPSAICITSLTAELTPMDLNQDGVIDTAMATVWANEFDRSSGPACDSDDSIYFRIEIIDGIDDNTWAEDADSLNIGCEVKGEQYIRLWVIDKTGSFDYCDVRLIVQNNMGGCSDAKIRGTLLGNIQTIDNQMIENVEVRARGEQLEANISTGDDGLYSFQIPMGSVATIEPYKNTDPMNGVSTMDLLKIQKHIIGTEAITSPYLRIAIDVNRDGFINALDLLELRELILGEIDAFRNNTSWRFILKDYSFTTDTPQAEAFPERLVISVDQPELKKDFIGVKIGDCDLDSDPTARSRRGVEFQTIDRMLVAGQVYEIPIYARNFKDVNGFQYTLQVNPSMIGIRDIKLGSAIQLDDRHFGFSQLVNGKLTSSWSSTDPVSLKNELLYSIQIIALDSGKLSDALTLNSAITKAASYIDDQTRGIALTFGENVIKTKNYLLAQNRPNPFTDQTSISFKLPESMFATMTLYDITGRVIKSVSGEFAQGKSQIIIDREDIPVSGIVYYELKTNDFVSTKKMVVY